MSLALEVRGLSVAYEQTVALDDVTFEIPRGVLAGIVGPNGAGKSTLLKAVMGFVTPRAGDVRCMGLVAPAWRKLVAYVPQRASVDWDFPITVRDVVTQGRWGSTGLWGRLGSGDHDSIEQALAETGLVDLSRRQIGELSGGQQQRVFLARALAQGGELLLMDEPFAGVDATTEQAILQVLERLRAAGKTVVVVHHDLATVRTFDWLVLVNRSVVASGATSTVYTRPLIERTYGGSLVVLDGAALVAS